MYGHPKYFEEEEMVDKVIAVIDSCETVAHYKLAEVYLKLAIKKAVLRMTVDYLRMELSLLNMRRKLYGTTT